MFGALIIAGAIGAVVAFVFKRRRDAQAVSSAKKQIVSSLPVGSIHPWMSESVLHQTLAASKYSRSVVDEALKQLEKERQIVGRWFEFDNHAPDHQYRLT